MKVYEVDYNGRVEKIEVESFTEAAEVWMASFAPEDSEAELVFVTDTTTGLRRKVVIYAEKSITYYARIIE